MTLRTVVLLAPAALMVFGARLAAHPGATSSIVLEPGPSSVDVILTTDPGSLRAKVEALIDRRPAAATEGDRPAIEAWVDRVVAHDAKL